jgi:hypothetical protein
VLRVAQHLARLRDDVAGALGVLLAQDGLDEPAPARRVVVLEGRGLCPSFRDRRRAPCGGPRGQARRRIGSAQSGEPVRVELVAREHRVHCFTHFALAFSMRFFTLHGSPSLHLMISTAGTALA